MEQITVTKKNNTTYNLFKTSPVTTVTKAEQVCEIFGANVVEMEVQSAAKINFEIGDKITVFEQTYFLNTLPKVDKNSSRMFVYTLTWEGVQYQMLNVLFLGASKGELVSGPEWSMVGTLKIYGQILVNNLNRIYPAKWALGAVPESEDLNLDFANENCLTVINRLCKEFGYEYKITESAGVNTVDFLILGDVLGHQFEYGRGRGLYKIARVNQANDTELVTRLYAVGGSENIKAGYRGAQTKLQMNSNGYIENADAVAKYGIIEAVQEFGEIYPKRTGKVTLTPTLTSFVDTTMDFDLNEADANGTKWLLPGQTAKIAFKTGQLAGYEFELSSYTHSSKSFVINKYKDDRGMEFPAEAFRISVGDEYTILEINMPESYVLNAESELYSKAVEYLYNNSSPKVTYDLAIDEAFVKKAELYRVVENPTEVLPAPYQYANIGITGGFAQYLSKGFVMKTQGFGVGVAQDQIGYLYIPSLSSSSISAILRYQSKYTTGTNIPNTITAGAMCRFGNASDAKMVCVEINNQGALKVFRRFAAGAGNLEQIGSTLTLSGVREVKIQRNATVFKCYYKQNGQWILLQETTLTLTTGEIAAATVGVFGSANGMSEYSILRVDNVAHSIFSSNAPTIGVGAIEAPWVNSNIATLGGVLDFSVKKNAEQTAFYMQHVGTDIWETADSFGFLHREAGTTFSLSAFFETEPFFNLTSIEKGPFARVGIMVRSGTGADAKNIAICKNQNGNIFMQYRLADGGQTTVLGSQITNQQSIQSFKLEKQIISGQQYIIGYYLLSGRFWAEVGRLQIDFADNARVGFLNLSHDANFGQGLNISSVFFSNTTATSNPCNKPNNLLMETVCIGYRTETF